MCVVGWVVQALDPVNEMTLSCKGACGCGAREGLEMGRLLGAISVGRPWV